MDGRIWLDDTLTLYRRYKSDFEKASAQVSDEEFFALVGGIPHSIAVLMKHVGENHRSRWRDFLTTTARSPTGIVRANSASFTTQDRASCLRDTSPATSGRR